MDCFDVENFGQRVGENGRGTTYMIISTSTVEFVRLVFEAGTI